MWSYICYFNALFKTIDNVHVAYRYSIKKNLLLDGKTYVITGRLAPLKKNSYQRKFAKYLIQFTPLTCILSMFPFQRKLTSWILFCAVSRSSSLYLPELAFVPLVTWAVLFLHGQLLFPSQTQENELTK